MNNPVWHDGEPANLAAAAADTLEWLLVLRTLLSGSSTIAKEGRARLDACIAALEKHLAASQEEPNR